MAQLRGNVEKYIGGALLRLGEFLGTSHPTGDHTLQAAGRASATRSVQILQTRSISPDSLYRGKTAASTLC